MHNTEKNDRARMEFFRLGVHYYAAGRFAALNHLIPVAGNLLHHAIEMFLKGALGPVIGLEALRNTRHDLNRIWTTFKENFPIDGPAVLDKGVAELHRFE